MRTRAIAFIDIHSLRYRYRKATRAGSRVVRSNRVASRSFTRVVAGLVRKPTFGLR